MAEKVEFKVTTNLSQVERLIKESAERALTKASMHMVGEVKDRAPVDTGKLRDGINQRLDLSGEQMTAKVGSPDKYAVYVEYGTGEFAENGTGRKGGWHFKDPNGQEWHFTRGTKPTKFLRNAFRDNKSKIKTIIQNEMRAID